MGKIAIFLSSDSVGKDDIGILPMEHEATYNYVVWQFKERGRKFADNDRDSLHGLVVGWLVANGLLIPNAGLSGCDIPAYGSINPATIGDMLEVVRLLYTVVKLLVRQGAMEASQ